MKVYVPYFKPYDKKLYFYNGPTEEAKIIVCSSEQKVVEFLWIQHLLMEGDKMPEEIKKAANENLTLELVNSFRVFKCFIDEIEVDLADKPM